MSIESDVFTNSLRLVSEVDPRISSAISNELDDQRSKLKLIASENYASPAVLAAMGN